MANQAGIAISLGLVSGKNYNAALTRRTRFLIPLFTARVLFFARAVVPLALDEAAFLTAGARFARTVFFGAAAGATVVGMTGATTGATTGAGAMGVVPDAWAASAGTTKVAQIPTAIDTFANLFILNFLPFSLR
ncbi:MAG: hypothetical protein WCO08_00665 [Actinomycetes bacterium]